MKTSQEIDKKQQEVVATRNNPEIEPGPVLQWNYKFNEQTGRNEFDSIELSDGSQLDAKSLKTALKKTTGTSDLKIGEKILGKVSYGMSAEKHDTRINEASTLLPALRPKDETEALLLGQFLALHDSGMKCLRLANAQDGFYHEERLFLLANQALKYGQSNHADSFEISFWRTANSTSPSCSQRRPGDSGPKPLLVLSRGGGQEKNRELNPMDHCGSVLSKKQKI